MALRDDLVAARDSIVGSNFAERDGRIVPVTTDVGYNEAVRLEATYLYADMVDSSGLVAISPRGTVGKVIRLYLDLSVRIIRSHGGRIRSFDGDRVMGIFIGANRYDGAVKAAMQIKWACDELIQPSIASRYKSVREAGWRVRPGCGIASGKAFIVRGGVRQSSNDLVSVGLAPNMAAKLSDYRNAPWYLRIGTETYRWLSTSTRLHKGTNMWAGTYDLRIGGTRRQYYRTSYRWIV